MTKNTLLLLLILTLLLVAGFFSGFMYLIEIRKMQSNVQNQPKNTGSEEISYQIKTYAEENKQLNYVVNIKYPEFSGIKDESSQNSINADIGALVFGALEDFKKNANCVIAENPNIQPCEFIAGHEAFWVVDKKLLSLGMTYYQYTQGAHGASSYVFLNYNIGDGKHISFDSVFKKNSGYMEAISDYARQDLSKKLLSGQNTMSDTVWIENGTKPIEDNYNTNVGFTNEGIVVLFQQYQVAAYAAGPQTIIIPYTAIKDFIDPNGLLGNFAN